MNTPFFATLRSKDRPPFWMIWANWMIVALLGAFDSLVCLLTLAIIQPNTALKAVFWFSKRIHQYRRK